MTSALSPGEQHHLERIRAWELVEAMARMPGGGVLLEIGAGTGWQARELANAGYVVSAVDISSDGHIGRFHPVQTYDGYRLPFADSSFDVVFSSNVLEHVKGVDRLLTECARVLRPDGVMIHVMPSVSWRLWTSLAHYPFLVRTLLQRGRAVDAAGFAISPTSTLRRRGWRHALGRALLAGPHGEYPSALHELLTFRRAAWRRIFEDAGWTVVDVRSTTLFYTGYGLLSASRDELRRALARLLGGACSLFTLRRAPDATRRSLRST